MAVLQPYKGRCYDPAMGSGGMFVQSADFVRHHQGDIKNLSIFGQEINANTRKMAMMNLAIRGIEADLGDRNADTFFDDRHPTLKADFVMANPPFNMSDWGADKLQEDVRWKYGIPPAGNANFAWLEHMISHLSLSGRIAESALEIVLKQCEEWTDDEEMATFVPMPVQYSNSEDSYDVSMAAESNVSRQKD